MGRHAHAGFTLIEVLVVIVVIGIASAYLVVNLGGAADRPTAEREAARFAGALEHAAARAQWSGETLGVSAEGSAYRFWRREGIDRWTALVDDDVLAPRVLPAHLQVSASRYAGAPVAADAILPFRPTGRNEPYALVLVSPAWSLVVSGDPLNRVQVAASAASR